MGILYGRQTGCLRQDRPALVIEDRGRWAPGRRGRGPGPGCSAHELCQSDHYRAEEHLILIQETLHQDAIDLLDNPTVLPIDHIVDDRAQGERHCPQISQHIVVILRGLTGGGLIRRLAVGRVDVRVYPIDQQAVYRKYPSLAPFSPSLASL